MYNYVCAISIHKKKVISPYAIKVGLTENYNNRFKTICGEVESRVKNIDCASLTPLFIIEGSYDKYTAERIEDALRLYYLNKLGYEYGYRQDWINSCHLNKNYDLDQEISDIENLVKWFDKIGAKLIYKNSDLTKDVRIYKNFQTAINHLV